jgi:hypothetical protein
LAQCTIVYAELGLAAAQSPQSVAQAIARQAQESLLAGQYAVKLKALSADEVREAMAAMPSGHERLALDSKLILLDAGAMAAYAPYRARVLLTGDPFAGTEGMAQLLRQSADALRIRIHDALITADGVVSLAQPAFDAIAPLVARKPEGRLYPATALRMASWGKAAIMVVNNEDDRAGVEFLSLLRDAFPSEDFREFDPASALDTPWKAVLQLGIARSSLPGARLCDAWAGSVPVMQLVNRTAVMAQQRRNPGTLADLVIEHGRTGLLFSASEEFLDALRDLLIDPLPGRSVARGARRRVDPAAQWDALLKAVLQ